MPGDAEAQGGIPLAQAQRALEAGRWSEAREAFEAVLEREEAPEALFGLGNALWWLGETEASVRHQERAYAAFRRRPDAEQAALAAIYLCLTYNASFGNNAAARGWLGRASSLIDEHELAPLEGWVELCGAAIAHDAGDPREAYAETYRDLRAWGITPHLTLLSAPPWARDRRHRSCANPSWCRYPPARSKLGEWREFAREATRRFPAATIEVWNEPNGEGSWRSGVDPERFAELTAAAYEAVKAENPGAEVLMGGIAGALEQTSNWMSIGEFLERAYAATPSLKDHTDAVNFHLYPGPELGPGSAWARTFEAVREVRDRHGDGATPLYVSETGVTTTGPAGVSERAQARRITEIVDRALAMDDVSGVLLYTLEEDREIAETHPDHGFGLLHDSPSLPLTPKRAYCELVRRTGADYGPCPPWARIDSGPSFEVVSGAPVSFSFSAQEPGASFACSLDWAPFSRCESPVVYERLGEGAHTFMVRATDSQGNTDPEPAWRYFGVAD